MDLGGTHVGNEAYIHANSQACSNYQCLSYITHCEPLFIGDASPWYVLVALTGADRDTLKIFRYLKNCLPDIKLRKLFCYIRN